MTGMTGIFRAGLMGAALVLAGCELGLPRLPAGFGGPKFAPALDVLALDYERTVFHGNAVVSGPLARAQRDAHIATPTKGRLRHDGKGPIPTEVKVEVTSLVTKGGNVSMKGTLILRDLSFGTVLAKQDNFAASGSVATRALGAGIVFRAVEDEILNWIETLDCDTRARVCGVDLAPQIAVAAAPVEVPAPVEPGADLALEDMVDNRPGGSLTKLVGGAIDPGQVIAAAAPPEAAAGGLSRVGSTVAALGLLSRSGFWLQTPLVSAEGPGEVRDPATGRRLTVTLIPKDGPAGGGSQISLAALNELGLAPTSLVTLEVFR